MVFKPFQLNQPAFPFQAYFVFFQLSDSIFTLILQDYFNGAKQLISSVTMPILNLLQQGNAENAATILKKL